MPIIKYHWNSSLVCVNMSVIYGKWHKMIIDSTRRSDINVYECILLLK